MATGYGASLAAQACGAADNDYSAGIINLMPERADRPCFHVKLSMGPATLHVSSNAVQSKTANQVDGNLPCKIKASVANFHWRSRIPFYLFA